jgi:hypothetical protein
MPVITGQIKLNNAVMAGSYLKEGVAVCRKEK